MVDNGEGEETASRGNEWEVVSLTASAYAAAPGPKEIDLNDDDKGNNIEAETSSAMFLSGHFVFPPSQHENLPVEPANIEIHDEHGGEDVVSELNAEEGGRSAGKDEENWDIKGLNVTDEFPGIQFFNEKGNGMSIHGREFDQGTTLQGLTLVDKELNVYAPANFSSFQNETSIGGSTAYDENTFIPESIDPSEQGVDLPADTPASPDRSKNNKYDESNLPCGAWWKRRAVCLYSHAKEAKAFWSVFIAAAVMGFVIIGQRWQQERWQVLQHKWQFSINDEKMGRMLGPMSRLKDAVVGGHRRAPFISERASSNH